MSPLAAAALGEAGFPWLALGLTALLGAWLALDETALAQTWFSQPLPAGILGGLLWGEPGLGLAVGLPLQLLAVGNLPVGQTFTGDRVTPLLGLVGAAAAVAWQVDAPFTALGDGASRLGWLLVAASLGSVFGDGVLRWERRLHNRLMLGGLRSLRDGRYEYMERAHVRCLLTTALRGALSTVAWCLLAIVIWLPLYGLLPERLSRALADTGAGHWIAGRALRQPARLALDRGRPAGNARGRLGADRRRGNMTGGGTGAARVERPACGCLWRVFLRTLSLQGSWNTQRMQNLGLAYSLLPWLRGTELSAREARRFCRRHYEYFNTNPYYANLLIGGLLRLEEENRRADGAMLRTVRNFKDSLGRALASLGDQFVWLGLQPALLVTASLAAAAGDHRIPLVLLAVFAAVQLAGRFRMLVWGYDLGLEIADRLDSPGWHRAIWAAKRAGALFTGVLAGLYAARLGSMLPDAGDRPLLLCVGLALGLSLAARRRWPGESLLLLLLPLAVAVSYL